MPIPLKDTFYTGSVLNAQVLTLPHNEFIKKTSCRFSGKGKQYASKGANSALLTQKSPSNKDGL